MTLKAGTAQTVITPPIGTELAGWAFGPSVGILDHLEAQALVLERDGEQVALVAADLLCFGPDLVAAVRGRVEAALGIAGERIVLAASHTHSGPTAMSLRQWGIIDEAYVRALESHLVGLIATAQRGLRDARVGVGLGRVGNIGENRRSDAGPVDTAVPVLRVDGEEGAPMAVLYSYGCHPVALHSYRNMISPDCPGYARSVIRHVLGKDVAVMFALGAAGDVNPRGYVAGGTSPQRARQIGAILGCEVAQVALDPVYQEDPALRVERAVVDLPLAPLPPVTELEGTRDHFAAEAERLRAEGQPRAEVSLAEIKRDWATDALAALRAGEVQRSRPCEVLALRLGDAALVAMPLEVFAETGLAIREQVPARVTFLVSNANGGVGYLPTRDAYGRRDYTNPQGLAPKVYGLYALASDAEPLVREAAIRMFEGLF